MQIAVVNSSTLVSDVDGNTIVSALNQILPKFCQDWGMTVCKAKYVPKGSDTASQLKVFLLDNAEVVLNTGVLPHGKCFVENVLQNGGVLLYSANPDVPTFASCVAHEVFELLWDPACNGWWDSGDGRTFLSSYVCDPVNKNTVVVTVPPVKTTTTTSAGNVVVTVAPAQQVGVSDWVLPAWADPKDLRGPYNHNNTLTKPFTLDKHGYYIRSVDGKPALVVGSDVSDASKVTIGQNRRLSQRLAPKKPGFKLPTPPS
jgi:hypothetical protein